MNQPASISSVLLCDAGAELVLDESPENRYSVTIESGTHIAVCFGQDARQPAAGFSHPNLAARLARTHEFKHYRDDGGKFWTSKPGVDLWFILPTSAVAILCEKGYSYVKGLVGDIPVTFNVSGGSGPKGGWTDWLGQFVHVGIGHSMRELARVAALSIPGTDLEAQLHVRLGTRALDDRAKASFNQAVAAPVVAREIARRFVAGDKSMRVEIAPGYTAQGVHLLEDISFISRLVWRNPTEQEKIAKPEVTHFGMRKPTTRAKSYVARGTMGRVRLKPYQIDWVKTASLNGIAVSVLS